MQGAIQVLGFTFTFYIDLILSWRFFNQKRRSKFTLTKIDSKHVASNNTAVKF